MRREGGECCLVTADLGGEENSKGGDWTGREGGGMRRREEGGGRRDNISLNVESKISHCNRE